MGKECQKMRAKAKDPALIRLIGEFLKVYLPSIKNRDQDTIDSYRHSMNVYLHFLQDTQGLTLITVRSCDFCQKNIVSFLAWLREERGNVATTINHRLSDIRGFCHYLMKKKAIAWFLPLKFASKNAARTLNVVVLIPPAHEPGDPPMNMRNMTSKSAALLRLAWLIVAKPAVRQVTDSKNALQILSPREKEAKPGLRQPSRKSIAAPPSTSQQVTPRTSLL